MMIIVDCVMFLFFVIIAVIAGDAEQQWKWQQ